jgi:hypothetical protein
VSIVIALAISLLVAVVGLLLGSARAFRCGANGCSGTMHRLGSHELDAYLEESANSQTPDDSVIVPPVPEVLVCDSCGEYIERRG